MAAGGWIAGSLKSGACSQLAAGKISSRLPRVIALRIQSENALKRGIGEYSVTSSHNPDSQQPAEKIEQTLIVGIVTNINIV